ncbi:RHG25 protein, partial [Crypturellus soui]|nr:RHG25 protein [Crypturellus soui]
MSLKLPRNWDFNLKMDAARIARSRSVMPGEAARPGSPRAPERPLKAGWLRKQRSIVRNWQQRFFVLRGQRLLYYKDEDEAKPQVAGAPAGLADALPAFPGAFQAARPREKPWDGASGEPARAGQDSCVLMASSQAEMDEWVKSIRRALGSANGGNGSGSSSRGGREGPSAQTPLQSATLWAATALETSSQTGPRGVGFLHEIQLNSSINKMSVDNLATVMGVNLIRPKIGDPAVIMRGTPQIQKVMTVMISDHADLFPAAKDGPPSADAEKNSDLKKGPVPRSSVGWDAAEDPAAPRADSPIPRQTRDDPNASSAAGPAADPSVPGEDNDVKLSKDTPGMWKMQSRKRTQTLPNRKSFLTAASQGEKGGNDKSDIFARDFWKSSPGTGAPAGLPDGHKRTLSHDLFKLLDLHRATAVDNAPTSPAGSGAGGGSSPDAARGGSEQQFLPSPGHQPEESGSGSAELGDPGRESKEFPHSVVLKLEREMEAQKNKYEEEIESLEKENYEVWAKVVRLNQEVEREKKKSEELEQKLRDMELLREDTERKNKMLEEEIKNLSQ